MSMLLCHSKQCIVFLCHMVMASMVIALVHQLGSIERVDRLVNHYHNNKLDDAFQPYNLLQFHMSLHMDHDT